MLLRRFTRHVKEQNWFAVFLDFLIVVVGVFIGIQLGNWNTAQQDRRLERGILERLHTEIAAREAEHGEAAAEEADVRRRLYDARMVLLGLVEPRPLTPEECTAVSRSDAPLLPDVGVAVIDELVSTGRLDLLTNAGVRSAVSEVHQLRGRSETRFNTYLRGGLSLIRSYPQLVPFGIAPTDDPEDEDGYTPAFNCDTEGMMEDPAFLNDFAQNVSIYATGGNVIRDNTLVIRTLHEALDEELGLTHGDDE